MKYLIHIIQRIGAIQFLVLLVLLNVPTKSFGNTTDSHKTGATYVDAPIQTEYEAEQGTLSEGATIQDCGSCSNNQQVGNLGGSAQNYFTYDLDLLQAGDYEMDLSFSSGDPRSIFIAVND